MSKKNNTKNTTKTVKNNKDIFINKEMERIMDDAEVQVAVNTENNTEVKTEEKPKKVYRSFKNIIIDKITNRTKNLPDYLVDPIFDNIAADLDNLEVIINNQKKDMKAQKAINRKLGKFSKEQIEEYLKSIN